MTDASRQLMLLARRVAAVYVAETRPQAILLAGSAAEGLSDYYSDLDFILYYDRLPPDAHVVSAREELGAADVRSPAGRVDGTESAFVEEYVVQGIECQILYTTIAEWEQQMATVLETCSPTSIVQKAIGGLLDGLALHGEDLIARWQERAAAYPDGLAQSMIQHYLRFFPLWQVQNRLAARDATIWYYQELVTASQNLLGVLAGLNRQYYSPFQIKRQAAFTNRMHLAPRRLATRLDELFVLDRASAVVELERLVAETVALVEAHQPGVDTASVRRLLGARQTPWSPLATDGDLEDR